VQQFRHFFFFFFRSALLSSRASFTALSLGLGILAFLWEGRRKGEREDPSLARRGGCGGRSEGKKEDLGLKSLLKSL
jgi:hypothetical protein